MEKIPWWLRYLSPSMVVVWPFVLLVLVAMLLPCLLAIRWR
jgi:hypothetical protein